MITPSLVTFADINGIDLTPVQDTPMASRKEDTYVHFNVEIEIQKHVEKLTKGKCVLELHDVSYTSRSAAPCYYAGD